MSAERDEAVALLNDVQGIESRVRQLLVYSHASDHLFLWGTIWLVGYSSNFFLRERANPLWLALECIGLIGTILIVAMHRNRTRERSYLMVARAGLSVVSIIAFGTLWVSITGMGWRETITFWPTLLSFFLFLIGLWAGRTLALASLAIFTLALTGYFVAGNYLHLWMAVVVGGAMIAGGVWLRR